MSVARQAELDEEALAATLPSAERRERGAYFTPAPLVRQVLAQVRPFVGGGPARIVDPACGAGAFLSACAAPFPHAQLLGLELSPESARLAQARVPGARIEVGDALRGGLEGLIGPDAPGLELWIGNPPYNGTSPLLRDPAAYAKLRALLPPDFALPPGTSLRDDYAFFLLLAAKRLSHRPGVLAFVTSATLLDAFLYAPLRRYLLRQLALREVLELPADTFQGTQVKTCVTIWSSREGGPEKAPQAAAPRFRRCSSKETGFAPQEASALSPAAPDWLLRPTPAEATECDRRWRANGQALTALVPISFPGLKTRFDELLTDDDPQRLLTRVEAFLACPPEALDAFARAHRLPEATWPKLFAHKASVGTGHRASAGCVRPFFRYAGAKHRGTVPTSAHAHCYLDRALIPRGDHRLRGDYDPHRGAVKLLFNTRELPLCAALLEEEGCVHAHRHSRFAPLEVPARLLAEGLPSARRGALGPSVPNLSPEGLELARRLGGPHALFRALVAFINGERVQKVWAPAFGALRDLPIPFDLQP
jgi:hypothetical protein